MCTSRPARDVNYDVRTGFVHKAYLELSVFSKVGVPSSLCDTQYQCPQTKPPMRHCPLGNSWIMEKKSPGPLRHSAGPMKVPHGGCPFSKRMIKRAKPASATSQWDARPPATKACNCVYTGTKPKPLALFTRSSLHRCTDTM